MLASSPGIVSDNATMVPAMLPVPVIDIVEPSTVMTRSNVTAKSPAGVGTLPLTVAVAVWVPLVPVKLNATGASTKGTSNPPDDRPPSRNTPDQSPYTPLQLVSSTTVPGSTPSLPVARPWPSRPRPLPPRVHTGSCCPETVTVVDFAPPDMASSAPDWSGGGGLEIGVPSGHVAQPSGRVQYVFWPSRATSIAESDSRAYPVASSDTMSAVMSS